MSQFIIQTRALTRRFGSRRSGLVTAVEGIDLNVPAVSVYGFLGPNGAGKTTTIRLLLGLLRPHAGEVHLFGEPFASTRGRWLRLSSLRRVGSLVETPSLYPHLTGRENLEIYRRLLEGTRTQVDRALHLVHLEADAQRPVSGYSLGMRQRLGLAVALLACPELLILDEPTNGLDPAGIHEMRDLITGFPREHGVTVFLSSHLLSEVEQVASHIGIVQNGRLIFQGTPDELQSRLAETVSLGVEDIGRARRVLERAGWKIQPGQNSHLRVSANGVSDAALMNAELIRAGLSVYHLSLERPSLEDIFLKLTAA
jgi:ABC-2 type transport system ATP-binding protein